MRIPCEIIQWSGASGLCVRTLTDYPLFQWGIPAILPAGFASDGMSVPRLLWPLLGAKIDSRTLAPSVVHDWLYLTHILTRSQADAWYRRALLWNGYPPALSWLVWAGVRLAGWSHWSMPTRL